MDEVIYSSVWRHGQNHNQYRWVCGNEFVFADGAWWIIGGPLRDGKVVLPYDYKLCSMVIEDKATKEVVFRGVAINYEGSNPPPLSDGPSKYFTPGRWYYLAHFSYGNQEA